MILANLEVDMLDLPTIVSLFNTKIVRILTSLHSSYSSSQRPSLTVQIVEIYTFLRQKYQIFCGQAQVYRYLTTSSLQAAAPHYLTALIALTISAKEAWQATIKCRG